MTPSMKSRWFFRYWLPFLRDCKFMGYAIIHIHICNICTNWISKSLKTKGSLCWPLTLTHTTAKNIIFHCSNTSLCIRLFHHQEMGLRPTSKPTPKEARPNRGKNSAVTMCAYVYMCAYRSGKMYRMYSNINPEEKNKHMQSHATKKHDPPPNWETNNQNC